ncbi:histone-like nucleoid-structuring protein, MvaT/MvaU family [Pseudomonas fluorescens]|uniref:histone-like nucleoid-structuring protein, MvaT/MvaU family n=1 Tax=Pseudomonas fluorescens TaxID=294 RepID=UPI00123F5AE2|nr:histone-like nucleoid-structuring protein, MvaT/MvaU family [Pseudomonas fluorescens]
MSKTVIQHRAIQAQIQSLQTELAAIEQTKAYRDDSAFVDALDNLLLSYGKTLRDAVLALDPEALGEIPSRPVRGPSPGTPRDKRKYKNPHTGQTVETASGNHGLLKEWRRKYPDENIRDWII